MTAETAVAVRQEQPSLTPFEVIEKVITSGDLSKMSAPDRVAFYWRTCESLGLNPLTRPFEYIALNGKLTLYARKDATDQLRQLNGVSVTDVRREKDDELGLITVYARGRDRSGRQDEASGVVSVKGLSGEAMANAVMKAETKAKRRLTLSLVGLGFLDESEIDGAGDGTTVDPTTGEISAPAKPVSLLESVKAQQAAMAAPDAPGAAETPDPVSPSAPTENAPAAPAVVVEGEATPVVTELTQAELIAALAEIPVSIDHAAETAKRLWPELTRGGQLTGARRVELLEALRAETPAVVGL